MRIGVIGAGVVGLTAAYECARRGADVVVFERNAGPGQGCSFYAGGMIAPWCERESAEPLVTDLGLEALDFWTNVIPVATRSGSLVVAPARDIPDVKRFSRRTSHFEPCDAKMIAALEPDLGERFAYGLYFPQEAHLEPRAAITALTQALSAMGNVDIIFSTVAPENAPFDWMIDATGFAAKKKTPALRGVRGEMAVLRTRDITLSRPIRMLHPRHPVYIVPRADHTFMIGATMIESEEQGPVTARALLELLGAAYTLHPAFGEASLVETGADIRPAFADNLPDIAVDGRRIAINGLYRHGFLLSPALARRAADIIFDGAEFPELAA